MSGTTRRWLVLHRPETALVSVLAALTTWVTLLAWTPFAERPSGFMVPILGACLLVAATGMLLRSARLPALVVLAVQLVVVLGWLHHRWAGAEAIAGWLPTLTSVRVCAETVGRAAAAAQSYRAPVPKSVPEFYPLLVLLGALTVVAVDFVACGLRRVPVAGLPLLALYTAPVSVLDGGVSWLKFAAAAVFFLALLVADEAERLSRWGRQLSGSGAVFDSQTSRVSNETLWSSARRIGLTATGLAVVVPLAVPSFAGVGFGPGGGGSGGDGSSVAITNPMVDLKRDLSQGRDTDLIRVTTTDPNPAYLRISVLDAFDGEAWRPSGRDLPVQQRADGLVPRPPGLDPSVTTTLVPATVQVSDRFASRWLPTPYPVYSIDAPGDWRYDRATLDFLSAADGQTTEGLTYRLRSLRIEPSARRLSDAGPAPSSVYGPNTALPDQLPAAVRRLATTVTEGARSSFERAVRLQQWFRVGGGFRYSLERSPGNGTNDLLRFLGTGPGSRIGYCEQFAASMALLGRAVGIPSRVAVGFLRPEPTNRDTFVYSSHDLHAWPEMYFDGVGWVRFEPTPPVRTGGAVPAYTTQRLPDLEPSASVSAPSAAPSQNRIDRAAIAGADNGSGNGPAAGTLAGVGAAGLLLLVVLVSPRAVCDWARRRRWAAASTAAELAEAGWAELQDSAVDLGISCPQGSTVRRLGAHLARSFARPGADEPAADGVDGPGGRPRGPAANPAATRALHRLVERVERARYSRATLETEPVQPVKADVHVCVEALAAGVGRSRRARARWLPASLLRWSPRRPSPRQSGAGAFAAGTGVDHAV